MWFDLLFKNNHVVGHSPVCENVFPFTKTGLDALDSTINFRNTVTWWCISIIALGFSSSFVMFTTTGEMNKPLRNETAHLNLPSVVQNQNHTNLFHHAVRL